MKIPAVLLLEDGTAWHGCAAGKIGTAVGEICFNTSPTGYQELFTDPSYYGQIFVATHVHIGNYGTSDTDVESDDMKIAGLVTRQFNLNYSRPLANHNLEEYFLQENKVAITDVDTRAIVRHIRGKGAMNCIVSSEITDVEQLKKKLAEVPPMAGLELSSHVSTKAAYEVNATNPIGLRVAVMDFGVKKNILRCFNERGANVKVFPAKTTYREMKADYNPHGFFISNGPGDPAAMAYAIQTVRETLDANEPLFGICLGQQLLAQAVGVSTFKMHNGHRGANHPVLNVETGQCEITTQNHGFGVNPADIEKNDNVIVTHRNLNDNSIEGIRIKNKKAFSVQYHPESSPGPHDSRYLFDQFIKQIEN